MGKLKGKVAVITAATSGMALATAKLFVEEGAYVFITGRRQDKLDEAVKLIGRNVTGVQGDAGNLADLDRLYDTVKREKGKIDILFASAGRGELLKLEDVTEEHFDQTFDLNVAARSSPSRRHCLCSTTTALSSSTDRSPASRESLNSASTAQARRLSAPSRAPGCSNSKTAESA